MAWRVSDIFPGARLFNRDDDVAGIYLLRFDDGEAYIGQAVDICARIAKHFDGGPGRSNFELKQKIREFGESRIQVYVLDVTPRGENPGRLRERLYKMETKFWGAARAVLGDALLNKTAPIRSSFGFGARRVAQVDIATNTVVAVFHSAQEAGRKLGIGSGKAIADCCKGTRSQNRKPYTHVHGWWFRYADTNTPPPLQTENRRVVKAWDSGYSKGAHINVLRVCPRTRRVKTYDSVGAAATKNGRVWQRIKRLVSAPPTRCFDGEYFWLNSDSEWGAQVGRARACVRAFLALQKN